MREKDCDILPDDVGKYFTFLFIKMLAELKCQECCTFQNGNQKETDTEILRIKTRSKNQSSRPKIAKTNVKNDPLIMRDKNITADNWLGESTLSNENVSLVVL